MIARTLALVVAVVAVVAVAAAAPAALAQPTPPNPDDEAARELYREGDRLYAEGRYEEALDQFSKAFELSGRATLLFNMANSYERLARYAEAAEVLRRYLPDATDDEKTALRKRIARLDERAEAQVRAAAARGAEQNELAALRAKKCPTCDVAAPPRASRASRAASYALLATGTVALTAGVVFGVVARDANSDALEHCSTVDGRRLCLAGADSALDRERRFAMLADISIATGLVASAAGGYLLWRAIRKDDETDRRGARIEPVVGADFAGVTFAGEF